MKHNLILISLFLCILQSHCTALSRSARSAEKVEKVKANYQIGYLENRDFKFDPFRVKNFLSLLKFEIIRGGNGIVEEGSDAESAKPNATAMPTQQTAPPLSQNPEAKDTPISPNSNLPIGPATTEMIKPASPVVENVSKETKRLLNETEIKNLGSKINFDYYLQGSFGISDSGSILEKNFTTLIFIDVHDKSGKLIRTVTFSQESKHFSEAEDLKQASTHLADRIMRKQENQETKAWWKFEF
ncbi:lipoprotein [Leptospira sp. 201903071]|uniref:lipoprotein n=1 Tax=Leptospira ainazelensis TaxID=2810034 RepID=UPI001964FA62|nr:lipoprotein [Leptospira ainazelensis]MBM9498966.1 lipoprotein [Leptospira ainazelensis]